MQILGIYIFEKHTERSDGVSSRNLLITKWFFLNTDNKHDPWVSYEVFHVSLKSYLSWWRHQMETFFALLAMCAGNSPVPGEFPAQRPGTRSFDVFFDLRLNKRFSKQSWGWWFETLSRPLWRHCNDSIAFLHYIQYRTERFCYNAVYFVVILHN